MNKVLDRYKMMINISFVVELLDILVGLLLIIYTDFAIKVSAVMIGSLMLIHGLYSLIRYFYDGLGNRVFAIDVLSGVVGIILGLFTIFYSFETIELVGVMFGIWLATCGLHKLYYSIKLMKINDEIYPLVSMISLLIIIMGVVIIFNPFKAFMLATKLSGIFMIGSALFELMSLMLFRKRAEAMLDLIK